MAYGSVLTDVVQSSTAATAPTFKDGNGTEVGTLCRAWVNFNGSGTVAIRGSFNVSSITDNGTGDYTVNLTTALSDANYCANITVNGISGTAGFGGVGPTESLTTSTIRFTVQGQNGASTLAYNPTVISVALFR